MHASKFRHSCIKVISLFFIAILFSCFLALGIEPLSLARAATFTIADGDVYGPNGLIAAINAANSNGQVNTIELAQNSFYTIISINNTGSDGDNGLPQIRSNLTINGNGAIIERNLANNIPGFRVFYVGSNAVFNLENLTIRNGKLAGNNSATTGGNGNGGALYNNGGILSITNTTFSNNSALGGDVTNTGSNSSNFGGIGAGGAIYNKGGTVSITESLFSNNLAKGGSSSTTNNWAYGGLGQGGGIFSTNGSVSLKNTIFSNNSALGGSGSSTNSYNAGTGSSGGGFLSSYDTLTIINSTFSNNASIGGDGSDNNGEGFGGGIESYSSTTTIILKVRAFVRVVGEIPSPTD